MFLLQKLNFQPHVSKGTRTKVIIFTLFFPFQNVVFPAQAEYCAFSVDFKLTIFL